MMKLVLNQNWILPVSPLKKGELHSQLNDRSPVLHIGEIVFQEVLSSPHPYMAKEL